MKEINKNINEKLNYILSQKYSAEITIQDIFKKYVDNFNVDAESHMGDKKMVKITEHYNTITFNIKYTKYFNFKDGIELFKMMKNIISNNPKISTERLTSMLNDIIKETKLTNAQYGKGSIKELMRTKQFSFFIVRPTTIH